MCSHRRVILHLSSKFRRDRKIGGGVRTSYRFFKMAAYSRKCTSGFRFSYGICLRRWKSICLPYFDEISQSTAEIKLLPFSENGRPPFWNSISSFNRCHSNLSRVCSCSTKFPSVQHDKLWPTSIFVRRPSCLELTARTSATMDKPLQSTFSSAL